MKRVLTVTTLLITLITLTGCLIDTDRPGSNPPSMMMERDSMPDKVDQRIEQANTK
ncbi:hypothetical protein SAMN05216339_10297 [Nitrosomonas eutropha]|uniref:Lipoprotein n=1 Tax=Nitrosomonas eutropha TaxID=916 RepID=A0A1I7FYY6_9PROT|nr:hypothetical protein [Nitrosomonas eutropha]SFU41408.1 hypothetical protein SAMN05216339_10297 [Nitrosomonas eutropha]